ncbi:MAG: cupin 2, conserved barrel domain protein [Rhizobacter sp.]|nr:cupin 2, conserved barrel domain protein [Rhizobacter sp.]
MNTRIAELGVRRLVTVDALSGRSRVMSDDRIDDVLLDPARPGLSWTRVWATDRTPAAALVRETIERMRPSAIPPAGGALFCILVLPPDAGWIADSTPAKVQDWFDLLGSPEACCHSAEAPHPYMQRTRTLDLCVVLDGQPTLVLDRGEVTLDVSDTVVQRGTRHAWSNRGHLPAVIAISLHDAD